jgi:hypothetical protein
MDSESDRMSLTIYTSRMMKNQLLMHGQEVERDRKEYSQVLAILFPSHPCPSQLQETLRT